MKRALLALAILFAWSCARDPVEPPRRLILPEVGTVSDGPPATKSLVVVLRSDGSLHVSDKEVSFSQLCDLLEARASEAGSHRVRIASNSNLHVLVRADWRVPWQAARWLMAACAEARVYRLFWAVAPEEGGEEGALALYLPAETGVHVHSIDPPYGLRVELSSEWPAAEPVTLFRAVSERQETISDALRPHTTIELRADELVSLGHVLRAADACFRAGISNISFFRPELPSKGADLKDLVVRALAEGMESNGMPGIRLDGRSLDGSRFTERMPPVSRETGRYVGHSNDQTEWAFESELDDEPEPQIPEELIEDR